MAHAQGQLSADARASFEEHLDDCPVCRDRLVDALDVLRALRELPEPGGPVDLVPALLARIEREAVGARGHEGATANGPGTGAEGHGPRIHRLRPRPATPLPTRSRARRRVVAIAACALVAGVAVGIAAVELFRGRAPALLVTEGRGDPASLGPPAAPREPEGSLTTALAEAVRWLERTQEPSGGWSASRWRGQAVYDVGLTGLAVIALVDAPGAGGDAASAAGPGSGGGDARRGAGSDGAGLRPAILRAADFLLRNQAEDGRFGPPASAALYNHGIATVALLEILGSTAADGDLVARLRSPVDRALRYIVAERRPQGGWGYVSAPGESAGRSPPAPAPHQISRSPSAGRSARGNPPELVDGAAGEPGREPNTSATVWPLQALLVARALGWEGLDEAIDGGLRHIARVSDGRGRVGYRQAGEFVHGSESLTAMAAFCVLLDGGRSEVSRTLRHRLLDAAVRARLATGEDLYRDFFLGSAILVSPLGRSDPWLETVVSGVSARQVRDGAEQGSWDASDPWAPAGGRLYETVVSALVLQAGRRAERLRTWTSRV